VHWVEAQASRSTATATSLPAKLRGVHQTESGRGLDLDLSTTAKFRVLVIGRTKTNPAPLRCSIPTASGTDAGRTAHSDARSPTLEASQQTAIGSTNGTLSTLRLRVITPRRIKKSARDLHQCPASLDGPYELHTKWGPGRSPRAQAPGSLPLSPHRRQSERGFASSRHRRETAHFQR
jgi:hypothetical protein